MAGEIFISYRRADQDKARLLHALLKQRGIDAWYDGLLNPGDDWRHKTAHALEAAPIFVLLFSKVASESDDISKELAAATFSKKLVIPVRIENIKPTGAFLYELASRNWIDAYEDTEAKLAGLADKLADIVKGGATAEVAAHALGAPGPAPKIAPAAKPWFKQPVLLGGIGATALALIAGVVFLTRDPATPTPPTPPGQIAGGANARVAFFGFTSGDDAQAKAVAASANDEGFRVLSLLNFDSVSRADALEPHTGSTLDRASELGARLAVEGSIRADGDTLNAVYSIVDVPSRTTVMQKSRSYSGKTIKVARYELGQQAIGLTNCTLSFLASYGDRTPQPSTFPLIGQACSTEYSGAFAGAARELAKRNPEGAVEAARLASGLAWSYPTSPEAARPGMLAEAETALARAEKLGPINFATADARISVAVVENKPPLDWFPQAEASLQRTPTPPESQAFARTNATVSWMMMQLGRMREGASYARIAIDSNPNYSLWRYYGPLARAASNQYSAWGENFESLLTQRTSGFTWEIALTSAIFMKVFDPEVAFAAAPDDVKDGVACYRGIIASLKAKDTKTRLAGAKKADACLTAFDSPHVNIMTQSALGDLDRAFAIADQPNITLFLWTYYPPFFLPPTKAMRADPRFLPLMQKAGYVEYWKQTKTHPDICDTDERDIPLCKALQ